MKAKKAILGVINLSFSLIVITLVVAGIYKGALYAYDFGYRVFTEKPVSSGTGRDVKVTVPKGTSVIEIGELLEEKGLIHDAKLFFVQEKLSAYRGKLEPGVYTLNTSMTAEQMMAVMVPEETEESDEMKKTSSSQKKENQEEEEDQTAEEEENQPVEEE